MALAGKDGWPGLENAREFPVTKLVFWGPAEVDYARAYPEAVKMARQFFANRGFGIPPPVDDWRAAQVAAYFFELINEMFEDYPVQVLRIECKGPTGETIVLDGKDLWHWRKAPKR
jgi:hypothetical protein